MPERIDFKGEQQVLPYDLAKKAWDDRLGSAAVQARRWQQIAFITSLITLTAVFGAIWLGSLPKSVPYIVSIDDQRKAVDVFRVSRTTIKDADVQYFLGMFYTWIRSVSVDPAVIQQNYSRAHNFLARAAEPIFANHYNAFQPFERAKSETRVVDVTTTVPVTANTWQVRWTESVYNLNGEQIAEEKWVAMVTVQRGVPRPDEIMTNPLGVYISNWNMQPDNSPTRRDTQK